MAPFHPTPSSILLFSENYSDCIVVCEGFEIPAHRAIICSQSRVLENDLQDSFKKSGTYRTHVHFELSTAKQMLQFLYTGNYALCGTIENTNNAAVPQSSSAPKGEPNTATQDPNPSATALLQHIQVNIIGDFYGVGSLQTLANNRINKILAGGIPHTGFGNIITQAFTKSSDKFLHGLVSKAVAANIEKLLENEEICYTPDLIDFSRNLLVDVIQDRNRREALLREQLASVGQAERAKREAELALANKTQAYTYLEWQYGICRTALMNHGLCRSISCEAVGTMAVGDENGKYMIRCTACRCVH